MKQLTVGQLIEELQRFPADKLVFIDNEYGEHSTLEGAYRIESLRRPEYHAHVYLAPTDE